ncbi:MAG: hypothetical protein LBB72_06290 [Spirochaetaceae bacterium]|jgi:hypothetical protein|nr:hypothetical protein [Spirochaetaceae bacterium]
MIFTKKRILRALAPVALVLVITAIFFIRKPVVLVTDKPFNQLYGEGRARLERHTYSFSLFRQVKTINIAEGAGPDLVAQAAASLSRRPLAVFFPYRYREGARRYLKDRPGAAVVILGGRNRREAAKEEEEPRWFYTDTAADLYRAGVLAGELALQDPEGGAVALYQSGLSEAERTAFNRGVKDQGWDENPLISSNNSEITSRFLGKGIACLVLLRKGDSRFFEDSGSLVLFTWSDPALVPGKTAAIFDDSPWAQLGFALKLLKKGATPPETADFGLIPSKLTIVKRLFKPKMGTIGINRIKFLKYNEPLKNNEEKPDNKKSSA